jgi:lipid-binding SYLF domain-containing protein
MKSGKWLLLLAMGLAASGCAAPKGANVTEQRAFALDMKRATLDDLYARKPEAKAKIEKAAGYGVFSNMGFALLLLGSDHGYGVVTNKATGKDTYMRMFSGSVGLGLGVQDFRAVLVFNDQATLDQFVDSGWEFGAEAGCAAKFGESGGSAHAVGNINSPIEIYEFTKNGLWIRASLPLAKFWKDKKLNAGPPT